MNRLNRHFWFLLVAGSALLHSGCGKQSLELTTLVSEKEGVEAGTVVYLDGQKVGQVTEIEELGSGEALKAHLSVELSDLTRERLMVGLTAEKLPDGIQLNSSAIEEGASALRDGDRVPFKSKVEKLVDQISSGKTITVILLGTVVIVVLVFLVKSLFRGVVLILALVLAGGTTVLAHPYAAPFVEDFYEHVGEGVGEDEGATLVERPDPKIASILLTGVASFLFWSILLGVALRKSKGGRK